MTYKYVLTKNFGYGSLQMAITLMFWADKNGLLGISGNPYSFKNNLFSELWC